MNKLLLLIYLISIFKLSQSIDISTVDKVTSSVINELKPQLCTVYIDSNSDRRIKKDISPVFANYRKLFLQKMNKYF